MRVSSSENFLQKDIHRACIALAAWKLGNGYIILSRMWSLGFRAYTLKPGPYSSATMLGRITQAPLRAANSLCLFHRLLFLSAEPWLKRHR